MPTTSRRCSRPDRVVHRAADALAATAGSHERRPPAAARHLRPRARRAAAGGTPTLASVSVPLRPLDFFDLIAAGRRRHAVVLSRSRRCVRHAVRLGRRARTDRHRRHALRADRCTLAHARPRCGDGRPQPPRLVGGFRFDSHGPRSTHWAPFPDASMTVAKLLIVREGDAHWAVCQHIVAAHDDPAALAHACLARIESLGTLAAAHDDDARICCTRRRCRRANGSEVRRAVDAIHGGAFGKVVLARVLNSTRGRCHRAAAAPAAQARRACAPFAVRREPARRRHAGTARACRGRRRAACAGRDHPARRHARRRSRSARP